MQELIGPCRQCGKPVYCRDGFLDGVVLEDGSASCFACTADDTSAGGARPETAPPPDTPQ